MADETDKTTPPSTDPVTETDSTDAVTEATPPEAPSAEAPASEDADATETTSEAPDAAATEAAEAAAADAEATEAAEAAADDAPAPVAGPPGEPGPSREERRAARDAARSRTQRAARTPEERAAERQERRRATAAQRRRYRARTKAKDAERRAAQPAPEPVEAAPAATGRPKVRQGIVLSAKPDKSISVRIDIVRRHRRYGKILRTSTTLHAHDEANTANEGDTVRVVECRPMSRTKRWRLTEVLERAR